jgi:hypothetical protein
MFKFVLILNINTISGCTAAWTGPTCNIASGITTSISAATTATASSTASSTSTSSTTSTTTSTSTTSTSTTSTSTTSTSTTSTSTSQYFSILYDRIYWYTKYRKLESILKKFGKKYSKFCVFR